MDHPRDKQRQVAWAVPFVVTCICAILLAVTMYINNCPKRLQLTTQRCVIPGLGRFAFEPLHENPLFGPQATSLEKMGALVSDRVARHGQWWRVPAAMWLHAGLIHLVVNMLALFFIGVRLEKEFGAWRTGAIYLLSGVGADLLSALFLGHEVAVGASGALMGLIGAALAELLTNWSLYANRLSALAALLLLGAVNGVLGLMPYVDNFANLGGLLTGLLLGCVLLPPKPAEWEDWDHLRRSPGFAAAAAGGGYRARPRPWRRWCGGESPRQRALATGGAVLLAAGFAGVVIALWAGADPGLGCGWCHYLNCVPTSLWTCDGAAIVQRPPICTVTTYPNGNGTLACQNAHITIFPNLTLLSNPQLKDLCTRTCG